jgi:uncharacterized membrane-anchored protein YhcB (DUF1043 family)
MIPDQNILLEVYGPSGLIISVLLGVVIFLYREVKGERKLNADLQEKRFDDIKLYNAGIEKNRETVDKLADDYKTVVDQLRGAVEQLRQSK